MSLAVLCALCACTRRDVDKAGSPEVPLVIVVSPAHRAPDAALAALDAAIERQAGMSVEIQVASSPTKAVEAFAGHSADVGLLTLLEALLARQEYKTKTLARVVRKDGVVDYAGEIVVRAGEPIQNVADLKGKRVAFVDELSVSGFVLPAAMLNDVEIAESKFMGSHDAVLAALKEGKVDAAATYQGASGGDPTLRVIATTPRVPNEPLIARATLDEDKAKRVATALMALSSTSEGRALLQPLGDITGFAPSSDHDYDAAIITLRNAGKQVEDAIAGGRAITRSNRAILLSD